MHWCDLALVALLAAGLLRAQEASAVPAADELIHLKKVYVERFGGGDGAEQIRDMVIATLQRANAFALTENPERADAILRGSAGDVVYTESFQSSDGLTARIGGGLGGSSVNSSSRSIPGVSVGDHESVHKQERKHEASGSVRLVNRDGDVIWSTIQESQGAKFKSAAADVADRIGRQLMADLARVRERKQFASTGNSSSVQ